MCKQKYEMMYKSPLGEILLCSDGEYLLGLHICGQTGFEHSENCTDKFAADVPVLEQTVKWLNVYFSEKCPDFTPPLRLEGTKFQKEVWTLLLEIPYGKTTTYGALAAEIANKRGIKRMSAQAVGGAVGSNPISIIVPCHRVVGGNGSFVGYNGGIDKKKFILSLEKPKPDKI